MATMIDSDDWSSILDAHPIFSTPTPKGKEPLDAVSLELSTATLPKFTTVDPRMDGPTPSGRRQVMVLKDSELLVAVGKEVRITSLGDTKLNRSTGKTFKTLHAPNIQFEIHQMALNPSGKLLAVAGAFQVAVLVLPRAGSTRLVPDRIDCKSVSIGQFYHGSVSAAPVAKIDWHPWGDAGSTLLVMTVDGKLWEYDISVDTEEPQQILSFVSEKRGTYHAEDPSEREVASFTLGKGRADWGPLTVYVVMRSGDVYAICPYMPKNASIPSAYVHSLECFIAAKQEFLTQHESEATHNLSAMYDYQRKYVTALLKQLPPGTVFPAVSRSVPMHPPTTIKTLPARQGPFLLQPAPRTLDGSEGGDATDIAYLAFGTDDEMSEEGEGSETEHLGIVMIAYQDGKVDLCLDVEKVEARWDLKNVPNLGLPMLAVYESIDLGIIKTLNSVSASKADPPILDLLHANHATFYVDPIYDDTLYVYHAFGVHRLHLGPVLQSLALALKKEDDVSSLEGALQTSAGTDVRPILTTFSVERRCSNPVVAITIPNDVYLTYSIFILTSVMRITSFPLTLRSEPSPTLESSTQNKPVEQSHWLKPVEGPQAYVSLLTEPYKAPPCLSQPSGLPSNPRLALPPAPAGTKNADFMLTPDTLRYIGTTVTHLIGQISEISLAAREADSRMTLQRREIDRLAAKCREMNDLVQHLRGPKRTVTDDRLKRLDDAQKTLLARFDRMLQSLMEKASPELSEHESKWFEELKRMKEEVDGAGRYDEGSLAARVQALEREYARVLPSLREVVEKENARKAKASSVPKGMGVLQAFELGERSNLERAKIADVEREILRLANRLEISVGQPPTLASQSGKPTPGLTK
ncbi:hypothetical protein BDN72DRAFT_831507 [Pluteus cervinus]|uniref:Uncharacterized protein n=1 Tax=Pluteus cervinus TaxID=181527 RepID=A0ACD3BEH5_9AGAR|nr:hypothetical protein BDN72DRAFT_831507 [Pluteus cervinus]